VSGVVGWANWELGRDSGIRVFVFLLFGICFPLLKNNFLFKYFKNYNNLNNIIDNKIQNIYL
jgi:hypothetical protein